MIIQFVRQHRRRFLIAAHLLVLLALVVSLGACRREEEGGIEETPIGAATEMVATQAPPTPTPAATEGPLTVNYTYDDAGRLIRVEYAPAGTGSDGAVILYTYDDAGNLLQREIMTNP